jgi:hypothetical protein
MYALDPGIDARLDDQQVSPLNDSPPHTCTFDPDNLQSNINVLTAIQNYTSRFAAGFDDIDLRFLVHYMGDVHQPLHLMLRERGGNGDPVLFEKRHFSLHGVSWRGVQV